MTKKLKSFCLIFFLISCRNPVNQTIIKKDNHFTTFEISFFDGWTQRISFSVDTTKAFIASTKVDNLQYGILPDSIFAIINKKAFDILYDKTITNKKRECLDCAEISALITNKTDTVRIFQKVDFSDTVFIPIIEQLNSFLDKNYRRKYHLSLDNIFETRKDLLPPLPPPSPLPRKKR